VYVILFPKDIRFDKQHYRFNILVTRVSAM